jgi:hypothetical protein
VSLRRCELALEPSVEVSISHGPQKPGKSDGKQNSSKKNSTYSLEPDLTAAGWVPG